MTMLYFYIGLSKVLNFFLFPNIKLIVWENKISMKFLNIRFYIKCMVISMAYIAKVTSKNMITIPIKIVRKYGIKKGMRVKFIEGKNCIIMVPIPSLEDLRGIDRRYSQLIIDAIRELEAERRREARE